MSLSALQFTRFTVNEIIGTEQYKHDSQLRIEK